MPEGVKARMMDPNRAGSRLLELALSWLVEDRAARIAKEVAEKGVQRRGAQALPSESESFYRK